MRRIAALTVGLGTLVLVACGGAHAADPAPRTPTPVAKGPAGRDAEPPTAPRILPNGPYPVVFAVADAAAQAKTRAAFMKSNPGWQMNAHPSGRVVIAHPPAPTAALGTESGARAFVDANAATWGVDAAAFDHPTVHGDQITFGVSTWGRYELGGFTVSPTSVGGVFLGPLGTPPRELDDETLTRLIVGRKFDFRITMQTTYHPCDPGPGDSGCPGAPPPPSTGRASLLVERRQVEKIERKVLGLTRPSDPNRWELRIVAGFSVNLKQGMCDRPYSSPNDFGRTACTYQLEVDGKPAAGGLMLDAVTGEPLFDRSLVIQVASVTSSRP